MGFDANGIASTYSDLMTTTGLARLFRVSRVSINNWRNRGCPCVLIPGDRRAAPRYILSDVVKWRESKKAKVPSWVRSRLSRARTKALPAATPARRRPRRSSP